MKKRLLRLRRRFTRFLLPVISVIGCALPASADPRWYRLDLSDILRIDEGAPEHPRVSSLDVEEVYQFDGSVTKPPFLLLPNGEVIAAADRFEVVQPRNREVGQ